MSGDPNQDQKSPKMKKSKNSSNLPGEAQFELIKSRDNAKAPTMSLENHPSEDIKRVANIK